MNKTAKQTPSTEENRDAVCGFHCEKSQLLGLEFYIGFDQIVLFACRWKCKVKNVYISAEVKHC